VDVTKIVSGGGDIAAERSSVANISRVADRIWTGGDLPSHLGDVAMLADLAAIQAASTSRWRPCSTRTPRS